MVYLAPDQLAALLQLEPRYTQQMLQPQCSPSASELASPVVGPSGCTDTRAGSERSFAAFVEQWFRQSEVLWKPSYKAKVRDILDRHLLPAFGATAVNGITRTQVLDYRAALARARRPDGTALSPSRINQILLQLRQILAEAADQLVIPNPAAAVRPLRQQRSIVDPLSLEQIEAFLEAVDPYYHDYFVVRFFTGVRTSEIDGLKWRFVDFGGRQIHVAEALVKGEQVGTKTPASERHIDTSSVVEAALRRQFERTGAGDAEYVFQAPQGGPLHYRNVSNRVWYPTLKKLGLRPRRPYQTRHTAATLWLAAGENPEWIARQMGHTDTNMLFSVYSRYVPNLTRRDGSAIERLLASRLGQAEPATDIHDEQESSQ